MFKKKMIMGLMALGLTFSSLTSCSSFFGSSNEFMISEVAQSTDEEGNIVITFTFTDDDMEPLVVTIPSGISGEDGVSISNIEYTQDEETGDITLYIYFSDDRDPFTFTFATGQDGEDGENGIGIVGVSYTYDEEGNTVITFEYSDGTFSSDVVIQKGTNGEDGTRVTAVGSEDDGSGNTVVTIYYSDGSSQTFIVYKGNDGTDGASIAYVEYSNDESLFDATHDPEDYYLLIVHYTDENDEENPHSPDYIYLPRDHGTTWYYGAMAPSSTTGRDGDFYLRVSNGYIYYKENGSWTFIFSIYGTSGETEEEEKEIFAVTFHPNGGTYVDASEIGVTYAIEGTTLDLDDFPEVQRTTDDYNIFAGWYKSASYDINAGQFTDTTVITAKTDLYARWVDAAGNVADAVLDE